MFLIPILYLGGCVALHCHDLPKSKIVNEILTPPAKDSFRFKIIQYGDSKEESISKAFEVANNFGNCYTLIQLNSEYTIAKTGPYWTTKLIVDIKISNVLRKNGEPKNFD